MTANNGNTRSRQARSHPDCLGRYRGTVKKSRRRAASRLASDKDTIAQAKTSTPIAPHVTAFFGQRLPIERHASENTRDSYAYAFRLLLAFASTRLQVTPSQLTVEQIDAPLVLGFLNDLEATRGNGRNSRNIRLAAIKSFMHFLEYRLPSAIEQIRRILAIPVKKTESKLVRHLTAEEMQALLDAPDPSGWKGIRDRAMLHLCYAGGLRASELIGVRLDDLKLQPQPSVLIHGKGRRERCLPLWKTTTSTLRAWLATRGTVPVPELFVSARGESLTRSGFEYILRKHVQTAKQHCPSLTTKRVHPHVLRHTCALTVLQATKDLRKVALWLGHAKTQTTEMYTRVDPAVKLETLESVVPPKLRSGRFKATDKLIAWLEAATFMSTKKPSK
jgi:integrase/recombinase XerD